MDEIHLVQIDSIPCHIPTTPKYYLLRNLFWFMVFKGPFLGFNVIIHNTTRTTALSVASLKYKYLCEVRAINGLKNLAGSCLTYNVEFKTQMPTY